MLDDLLKFGRFIHEIGGTWALVGVVIGALGWIRGEKANKRADALADQLIANGQASHARMTELAFQGVLAQQALAKAVGGVAGHEGEAKP